MNRDSCQTIEELLVEFADDALPSDQAAQVREHVEQCPHCRETVAALRQSLEAAQTIWQDNARPVSRTRALRSKRWPYVAAAAGILLMVGTLLYRLTPRPQSPGPPTMAEIERRIAESGHAAGLLARISQLEAQTSLPDAAESQYRYLAEKYPDTAAAESARLKLKTLR